jgi:hypothetical protein
MSRMQRRQGRSHFVLGVILLSFGAALLALNLGFDVPWHLWRYFPVPMIAFGLWGILSPARDFDRVGALWLLTGGLYCLIGVFQLFGLGWSTAWPLYIVAAGIVVIARKDGALLCRRTGKDQHESSASRTEASGDQ